MSDRKRILKANIGEKPNFINAVFTTFTIKKPIIRGKKSIRRTNSGLKGGKKILFIE